MKKIPPAHKEFIRLMALDNSITYSYQNTIKANATPKSSAEAGSRLSKRYALQIQEGREKNAMAVERANSNKITLTTLKKILTQSEVDAELCRIIIGDEFEIKVLSASGKVITAKVTPTISERRGAIETYNKRFGSNATIKTEIINNSVDLSKLTFEELLKLANDETIQIENQDVKDEY